HHYRRSLVQQLFHSIAGEIEQDALARYQSTDRHGERGGDPFQPSDGDGHGGGIDRFRYIERRVHVAGDGVFFGLPQSSGLEQLDAQRRAGLNQPGRDPPSTGVDPGGTRRNRNIETDPGDLAIADDDRALLDLGTGNRVDRGTGDRDGLAAAA